MTKDVLFEEIIGKKSAIGLITLNRTAALNALNHDMVKAIDTQLQNWEASHIQAVVIRAKEGRAFCAGGDIRLTYERIKSKDKHMLDFFRDEYQLNKKIFHYPKPYIAFLDGITMGGGVGISIHGSHRIVTDQFVFAMPETAIGFFPDVGGTYFLPRLNLHMGYYLGLTGARINSDDSLHLGIATQKISRDQFENFLNELSDRDLSQNANKIINDLLVPFNIPAKDFSLASHDTEINHCFNQPSMESIMQALAQVKSEFTEQTIHTLNKKSPTSLKVSLQAMQKGKTLDFDACMQQEYRLVSHFLKDHDFQEGIRAVIIDKDHHPQWQPATLTAVSPETVNHYFDPILDSKPA